MDDQKLTLNFKNNNDRKVYVKKNDKHNEIYGPAVPAGAQHFSISIPFVNDPVVVYFSFEKDSDPFASFKVTSLTSAGQVIDIPGQPMDTSPYILWGSISIAVIIILALAFIIMRSTRKAN